MPYLNPEDIDKGLPWGDPNHTVPPFDHGTFFEDAAQLNWEYMIPQVDGFAPKNPSLKEMWEYFISIPQYWVKHYGVDGFRCDVAYRVPQAFWRECIRKTRELSRELKNNLSHDVIFIAETYTDELHSLQEAGFSCVYSDYSHKLGRPLELKGYLDYLYNISGEFFPDGSKWFLFPESHDFARTPQKILGAETGDFHKALLANQSRYVLTATLPGVPLIFNGFEKVEWQPVNLFAYGAVDWQRDLDLKDYIAAVNAIRHKHIALRKGTYHYVDSNQGLNEQTQLFSFLRVFGEQTMLVVVNMDVHHRAGPATLFLPESFKKSYVLTDLLTKTTYKRSGQELPIDLDPGQSHIFLVE
jgi:glycosidase